MHTKSRGNLKLQGTVELSLRGIADSTDEEVQTSEKLDQVKKRAEKKKITFSFKFDRTANDRRIETDNGWRITLGRGLDIFQKVEKKFSLGFIDQAQRNCKPNSIVYART